MSANPLRQTDNEDRERLPVPRGNSDEEKAARINFWIQRGNAMLEAEGQHHLHWVCRGGYYSIESRP